MRQLVDVDEAELAGGGVADDVQGAVGAGEWEPGLVVAAEAFAEGARGDTDDGSELGEVELVSNAGGDEVGFEGEEFEPDVGAGERLLPGFLVERILVWRVCGLELGAVKDPGKVGGSDAGLRPGGRRCSCDGQTEEVLR